MAFIGATGEGVIASASGFGAGRAHSCVKPADIVDPNTAASLPVTSRRRFASLAFWIVARQRWPVCGNSSLLSCDNHYKTLKR